MAVTTSRTQTCVLQQGAYVFTGGLTFQNTNSHLTSNGQPVTLFFAGPNGYLDIKNGDINNLAAPTTTPLAVRIPSRVARRVRDHLCQRQHE